MSYQYHTQESNKEKHVETIIILLWTSNHHHQEIIEIVLTTLRKAP